MNNSKNSSRKRLVLLPLVFVALVSLAPVAQGYGNSQTTQLWQLTISSNCNNPTLCGSFSGGFWAWAVLNSDGTFDASTTGCGHSGGPALDLSPPYGGASHCNVDGIWNTNFNGVEFLILNETDTCSNSPNHGQPTTTTTDYTQPPFSLPNGLDTGVPLVPGHYSISPAPGITTQIQVVYIGP